MSLLHRKVATIALLSLIIVSGVMAVVPANDTFVPQTSNQDLGVKQVVSESNLNVSIPYVDAHYGFADGIIDPEEYAYSYTDSATGVTVYLEQNSSIVYVGLSAPTSGWVGIGWQNETGTFTNAGLNGSDLLLGYAPGTPHAAIPRVTGSDSVTVHYELYLRNGTFIEDGNIPRDDSTTPISDESLLQGYKDAIIGMRVGEVRHFIIHAEDAYNVEDHPFYGFDLEYVITLTRMNTDFSNPADAGDVVYSDRHGTSTFQSIADANQSQILDAGATDDGTTTQIEYFIQMNSTDTFDIPLLNNTDIYYPMVLLFSNSENFGDLPVQHTDWSNPLMAEIAPNSAPVIIIESPEQDAVLFFVTNIQLNITDDSWIRKAWYKFNDDNWTDLSFNFLSGFWETSLDLSEYETGAHTLWFNATDPSNVTTIAFINITIDWPFLPLLGMKLDVERTVFTRLYHSTEVVDDFVIRNNGSAPIGAIEILMPSVWSGYFLSLTSSDNEGNEIRVERLSDYNGMMRWRLHFYEPIDYQEELTFQTSMYLHSLHTLTDFDENLYELSFLKYPVLPYVMTNFHFTISFRSGDSLAGDLPTSETINIAPIQIEGFTTTIESFTPFVIADRVTEVTIDPWGWMSYVETITLENVGPARDSSIQFLAPAYSSGITVYDEVGVLATSKPRVEQPFNETAVVPINLQNDRFGVDGFYPGYKYTFHISFDVQISGHTSPGVNGDNLVIPIGTIGDILVGTHVIEIVVPSAVTITSASGDYRLLHGVFDAIIQYKSYNTTAKNPAQITLMYQVSLAAAARPAAFALIIGLIAAIYVISRKFNVPVESLSVREGDDTYTERKQVGAPPELLREFATLYSRKTALGMDLEKLESQLRRGKVKKREYLIRDKDLKLQLAEVDAKLPDLKDKLMAHGSRYRDMVAQLELQEEKIEGAKAGLRQLLLRKKKQRISRVAFERNREDYLKTIKRATTETDKILLSIQEEVGDI